MPLTTLLILCLERRIGLLLRDEESGLIATVDTPDAAPCLAPAWTSSAGRWTSYFSTPTNMATISAVTRLCAEQTGARVIGPAEESPERTHVDRVVAHGDRVKLGATGFEVLDAGRPHAPGPRQLFRRRKRQFAFVGDTPYSSDGLRPPVRRHARADVDQPVAPRCLRPTTRKSIARTNEVLRRTRGSPLLASIIHPGLPSVAARY